MNFKTILKLTTLSISGGIIGVITGQFIARYIFRPDIVNKNTVRWYLGTFSPLFTLGLGAVFIPYKIMSR